MLDLEPCNLGSENVSLTSFGLLLKLAVSMKIITLTELKSAAAPNDHPDNIKHQNVK